MSKKTRVDVEDVLRIDKERRKINRISLEDIEWYENGVKLDISNEVLENFRFTALSNMDFIIFNVYKLKKLSDSVKPAATKKPTKGMIKTTSEDKK